MYVLWIGFEWFFVRSISLPAMQLLVIVVLRVSSGGVWAIELVRLFTPPRQICSMVITNSRATGRGMMCSNNQLKQLTDEHARRYVARRIDVI